MPLVLSRDGFEPGLGGDAGLAQSFHQLGHHLFAVRRVAVLVMQPPYSR